MPKNVQVTTHLNSSHKLAKYCSKFSTLIFNSTMNRELPDVQSGFRKARGTRDQIANICWITEKAREFQKNIYFCLIDYAKPLMVWITTNCGEFFKRWKYQTTWPASWEICMQARKQQLELVDKDTKLAILIISHKLQKLRHGRFSFFDLDQASRIEKYNIWCLKMQWIRLMVQVDARNYERKD